MLTNPSQKNSTSFLLINQSSILVFTLVLAVILRMGAALLLGDTLEGDQQVRVFDQKSYNALAKSLLAGKGYSFERDWYPDFTLANTPTAHWSFLYPLYLAAVYVVTGYHPLAARLLQVMLVGILAPWLVYRLGRRLFGISVGLVGAGLTAIYAYFVFHDATLMTEPFFIVGVLGSMVVALRISDSVDQTEGKVTFLAKVHSPWLLLGIILGLTGLLRQTILLWVPFLYGWLAWRLGRSSLIQTLKGLALSTVVVVLVILPWTVRNYLVYHAFLPLNSNVGYAFYSANHPYHGVHFDQDYAAPLPEDLMGKGMNEAQWNNVLTKRGLQFILDDPRRYILLSLDRVRVFFNFWFSADSSLSSNLMRVLSFGLYLPLFVAGLYLSRHEWRRCSLIYLFVIVFSGLHIMTWASNRYRLPVDAALMPFAGLAVIRGADLLTKKSRRHKVVSI